MTPLCVRFCNTVDERPGFRSGTYEIQGEQFGDKAGLAAWMSDQPEFKEIASSATVEGTKRLVIFRETVFRLLGQICESGVGGRIELAEINRYVKELTPRQIQVTKLGFELVPAQRLTFEENIIEGVVNSVLEILTHSDFTRLRVCSAESCSWLFWDTSKNGSRKWCDMGDCGNREKARRFRERA